MEPRIQYAKTSDGVAIAYATAGQGRTLISVPSPPLSHVQRQPDLLSEHYRGFLERFRAVWYDSRGSGMSDRRATDFTMPAMLLDLEAVADRAGGETFVLYSVYDGVSIAIAYAAKHPDRVSHLVLVDGRADFTDYLESPTIRAEIAMREQDWVLYTEALARVFSPYEGDFAAAFAEHVRAAVEPEALRLAFAAQTDEAWNVSHLLDQIKIPTLVMHNRGNRFLSPQVGQRIAAGISDARFRLIDDVLFAEVPRLIEEFVARRVRPNPPPQPCPLAPQSSSSPTSPTPRRSPSASATTPSARKLAIWTTPCAPSSVSIPAPRSKASSSATASSPSSRAHARPSRPPSPAGRRAATQDCLYTSACTPATSSARRAMSTVEP